MDYAPDFASIRDDHDQTVEQRDQAEGAALPLAGLNVAMSESAASSFIQKSEQRGQSEIVEQLETLPMSPLSPDPHHEHGDGGSCGNTYASDLRNPRFATAKIEHVAEDLDVNTAGVIEETLEKLTRLHGVLGIIIIDRAGVVVRTTLPPQDAARYAVAALQLTERTQNVVCELDPRNGLELLCVRTMKHEMLLCSAHDGAFTTLVLQNPYV
uniref:Roadblock/LAMTOR2 domain-containing protein n=1 Tax=Chrysotila carterae TaxID=13221 RepID=A0A7S4FB65_CHRCT|mmetsp:Transcript_53716/g.117193  ORF Transcript_53716/g.117193 Transcript_53716/m.117193 type:complete len:212 (+) Transcript_53716:356-991(+)|eukprot:4244839-Pleurochrysis_carterae.AAC.8